MRKITVALCAFLLAGLTMQANPTENLGFSIHGQITDNQGNPLVGATITLENTFLGTYSGVNGYYQLSHVREGSYTLIASYLGFETIKVDLKVDKDMELNLVLKPSSQYLEAVVVSSTRASNRMPIAQTTLNREQLEQANTGGDTPYLLDMLPSVVVSSESGIGIGNTAFRIRGTDPTRINVTINGVPLNDAESQGVYWVDLPDFTASVDNVQVQRGVGTSTNGAAAFGATVNFQTSITPPEPFASIDLLGGSYNTWKTSARVGTGLTKNGFSMEGRFSQLHSDGYIERAKSDHRSMFVTAAWHGERSQLRANIIYGEEHTGITWEGTPDYMMNTNRRYNPAGEYVDDQGVTRYYDDQKDNYWQTHYHLIATHSFASNLTANVTLHLTDGRGYYEEYKPDRKLSKYGLPAFTIGDTTIGSTDFIQQKWMDNIFYGGIASVMYRSGNFDITLGGGWNRYDGDHFGKILWSKVNVGLPNKYEWYNNNGLKTDWNTFAKVTWQITDPVTVFADVQYRGIAYELNGIDSDLFPILQNHDWNFINPKTGATFRISSGHELYFSFAVAHREPARSDLKDAQKGSTDFTPKPERLNDWELGYRLRLQNISVDLNYYYMHYKDQLVLTGELTDVGYARMANVPNSYRTGVELSLSALPFKWLKFEGNTTLSKNIIKNYTNYANLTDNPTDWNDLQSPVAEYMGNTTISFSPSVITNARLTVTPMPNMAISLVSKYVSRQYIDNTENEERSLDPYWVNNLVAEYRLNLKMNKRMFIQISVNNLFNNKYSANAWVYRTLFQSGDPEYVSMGYYPQAERHCLVRLGVEF
ncbi:MAG TPA: TonB-dependent receptor [Bacteroidales bacterium]|nr:TonB-dependent receptor [Bacteroidales bacterium]